MCTEVETLNISAHSEFLVLFTFCFFKRKSVQREPCPDLRLEVVDQNLRTSERAEMLRDST